MTDDTSTPRSGPVVATCPGRWRHWAMGGLAALTAYSTGVAWQAQAVSYPLYRAVSPADFPDYHRAYNRAIPGAVIAPGFLGFLACAAFPWSRPPEVPRAVGRVVAGTGVGSLLVTVLWAIPRHDRLDRVGQDAATVDSLLRANAVRTGLLTVGTVALVVSLVRAAPGAASPG